MPKRVEIGVVTRAKTPKTRRVEIQRFVRHRRYGKYVRHRTVCYVHDEDNVSEEGDTVEIEESRPLSRLKRWRLLRVVTRGSILEGKSVQEAVQENVEQDDMSAQPGGERPESGTPSGDGSENN